MDQSNEGYILQVLQNRYNQEVEKTNRIRNQSIFILTATGFLVSICIGIMSANWFELSFIHLFSDWVYGLLLVELCMCIIPPAICLFLVSISAESHYFPYPPNEFYFREGKRGEIDAIEMKREVDNINHHLGDSFAKVCMRLEDITSINLHKNLSHRKYVTVSAFSLLAFFVTLMILFVYLITAIV